MRSGPRRRSHGWTSSCAEVDDLPEDLIEVVELLPAGRYKRARLCDQLNSIITAHGWAYVYGTVE